jgi:hypothetical protein
LRVILLLSIKKGKQQVWPGFDPNVWRDLTTFREMVALRYQTPQKEWPLIHLEQHNALLVVREWPDGSVTAYLMENPQG